MTDREMLEMAAKAAGWDSWDWLAAPSLNVYDKKGTHDVINPLTDDGDALRLAVKLDMSVDIDLYETSSYAYGGPAPRPMAWELWKDDKAAATRRAITRAAAEIGKAMK